MKHIISVTVKNEAGILSRLSNLFSSRGYVIESFTIAPSLDEKYARATIVTVGDDAVIEQITKQLNRLIPVISVSDSMEDFTATYELVFAKVKAEPERENELQEILNSFDAKIIECNNSVCTIRFVCTASDIRLITQTLKPFELVELVRSGAVAI